MAMQNVASQFILAVNVKLLTNIKIIHIHVNCNTLCIVRSTTICRCTMTVAIIYSSEMLTVNYYLN